MLRSDHKTGEVVQPVKYVKSIAKGKRKQNIWGNKLDQYIEKLKTTGNNMSVKRRDMRQGRNEGQTN